MIRFLLVSKTVFDFSSVMKNGVKGFVFLGCFESDSKLPEAEIILTVDQEVSARYYFSAVIKYVHIQVGEADDTLYFSTISAPNSFIPLRDLLVSLLPEIPYHPRHFIFSSIKESFILRSSEILYLKADGHNVDVFFTNGKRLPIFQHLGWFEKRLPLPFFRVQKSYMINGALVKRIRRVKKQLWLRSDERVVIPFGKSYVHQIELIEEWIRGRRVF